MASYEDRLKEYQAGTAGEWKSHVVKNLRSDYPEIPGDMGDDDVIRAHYRMFGEGLDQKAYEERLDRAYASDYTPSLKTPEKTLGEKAGEIGQAAKALPGEIVKGAVRAFTSPARQVVETAKTVGPLVAGRALEQTASQVPAPDIEDLRARGYSEDQIQNIVRGYTETQQSILGDVQDVAQQGIESGRAALKEGAEAVATYGTLPLAGAVGRSITATKSITGGAIKGAAEGAAAGAAYGAVKEGLDAAIDATIEGKRADEILGIATKGALSGVKGGALIGGAFGGVIGGVVGGVGASRAQSAARKAAAAKATADALAVRLSNFGENFNPTWLRERFPEDFKLANDSGLTDDVLAANIIRNVYGDEALASPAGQRALADITEKITKWRSTNEALAGPMVELPQGTPRLSTVEPGAPLAPVGGLAPEPMPTSAKPETLADLQGPIGERPAPFVPPSVMTPEGPAPIPMAQGIEGAPVPEQRPVPLQVETPAPVEAFPGYGTVGGTPARLGQPLGVEPPTTPAAIEPAPRTVGEPPVTPRTPPAEMELAPRSIDEGIALTKEGGGSSYDSRSLAPIRPNTGYTVTLASTNVPTEQLTPEVVKAFRDQWDELVRKYPQLTVGTFNMGEYKPGMTSLDLNVVMPSGAKKEAVALAKSREQFSIWDNENQAEVKTGFSGEQSATMPSVRELDELIQKVLPPVEPSPRNLPKGSPLTEGAARAVAISGTPEEQAALRRAMQTEVAPAEGFAPEGAPDGMRAQVAEAITSDLSPVVGEIKLPPSPPAPGRWHAANMFADANIVAAKARMAKRGTRLQAFVDPADLADVYVIGANYMLKGAVKFAEWSEHMVREFGEAVRPHLQRLYQQSTALYQSRRPTGNDEVRRLSTRYLSEVGLGAGRMSEYHPLDEGLSRRIATAYDRMPKAPSSERARLDAEQSYAAFAKEVESQYRLIEESGIKIEFTTSDPYPNSAAMMRDLRENRRLRVFKTDPGTGTDPHPYLTPEQNDKFRAVHDFFGHAGEGYEFGPRGEDNAWRKHASMFSNMAIPAMTTETRGQNSWVNFLPKNMDLPPRQRPFAEQKFGLLPPWAYDEVVKARLKRAEQPKLATDLSQGKRPPVEQAAQRLSRGVRPVKSLDGQNARADADAMAGVPEHLSTMPESADWYSASITRMEETTRKEFPELKDTGKMTFFKLLLAVTSPQTNVPQNYARATMLWDGMRASGKAPLLTRQGKEVNVASRTTVPAINKLISDFDGDYDKIATFLLAKNPKGEYNAVTMFGPKVGRFFLNLSGIHDEPTIDVWMGRWWRRTSGNLFETTEGARRLRDEKLGPVEHRAIMEAVKRIASNLGMSESAVQATLWDREKAIWTQAGLESPSIDFAKAAEAIINKRNLRAAEVTKKLAEPDQRDFFGLLQNEQGYIRFAPDPPKPLKVQQKTILQRLLQGGKPVKPDSSFDTYSHAMESLWLSPDGQLISIPDHATSAHKVLRNLVTERTSGHHGMGDWAIHAVLQRGFVRMQVNAKYVQTHLVTNPTEAQRRVIGTMSKGRTFYGVVSAIDGTDESQVYQKWTDLLRNSEGR